MQRPQKIKEKLDKCKSCKKSFKGEANAKLRREKQKNQDSFVFPFCSKPTMQILIRKGTKKWVEPNIQTNPMKNLKIYGNFLRNKLNFQMSNCKLQQKPLTLKL